MLSNFPLHTRKGRQSFETWIRSSQFSGSIDETEAQINRSNLSLSKTNLSSQTGISRPRKRYFTNIERQKWHTPPCHNSNIESKQLYSSSFFPFFSIYHWQTGGGGGNGHGDSSKKLGGQSSQTSSLSPLAKPLDPPRLVARLETCHYRGEFSRRRYPPVMADGVKGDQRWPRFFRSFEISTKLVQGEFRSNEKEEGKRREKMRESRRRELSREGNFFSNFLVGHRTLSGLAGLIDTWRVCCAPRFPDSTN